VNLLHRPFLSEDAIDKIALRALDQHSSVGELRQSPFFRRRRRKGAMKAMMKNGGARFETCGIAPFMDRTRSRIVKTALREGTSLPIDRFISVSLARSSLRAVMARPFRRGTSFIHAGKNAVRIQKLLYGRWYFIGFHFRGGEWSRYAKPPLKKARRRRVFYYCQVTWLVYVWVASILAHF
jgi:hypothetical protein